MISQEQILKKQNENKMLRCQFAARVYFNNAELLNYASWAFSVLSALTLFLPNGDSTIIMVTPLIIDIIAYLFHYFAEKEVNIAAKLRNYFDSVVLNIHPENYQEIQSNHLWEKANKVCSKRQKDCQIQMSNTGRDTPPGVKDWYELSNNHSGRNPVYECQLQNCWWNNKLCRKRIILSSAISVVLIALSIIAMDLFSVGVIRIAVCFITLFFNLIDSIRDNIRYIHLSMKMDTLIETPDIDKVPSQIEYLQELICRRREILVLEINILHKKFAKKWSEEYEQISKDSVNIS